MRYKKGETAHLKRNMNIFGKKFKYNDGLEVISYDNKRESYLCQIEIKGEMREIELAEKEYVSPETWKRTQDINKRLKELGLL